MSNSSAIGNRRTEPPIPDRSSPSLGHCPNCGGQVRTCYTVGVEDYTCDKGCGFWISNLGMFFTDLPHISQRLMRELLTEKEVLLDDLETCGGKRYSVRVKLDKTGPNNRWEVAIEAIGTEVKTGA